MFNNFEYNLRAEIAIILAQNYDRLGHYLKETIEATLDIRISYDVSFKLQKRGPTVYFFFLINKRTSHQYILTVRKVFSRISKH